MSETDTPHAEPARKHVFMCVWCGGNIELEHETEDEAEAALQALRLHHLECEKMPMRGALADVTAYLDLLDQRGFITYGEPGGASREDVQDAVQKARELLDW